MYCIEVVLHVITLIRRIFSDKSQNIPVIWPKVLFEVFEMTWQPYLLTLSYVRRNFEENSRENSEKIRKRKKPELSGQSHIRRYVIAIFFEFSITKLWNALEKHSRCQQDLHGVRACGYPKCFSSARLSSPHEELAENSSYARRTFHNFLLAFFLFLFAFV